MRTEYDDNSYYKFIVADARNMHNIADNAYGVAHSNSVIEHVGNAQDMQDISNEIKRIGSKHFVQTPNYWFIIEPHFRFAGFQWLPHFFQTWLVKNRNMGSLPMAESNAQTNKIINSVQLIKQGEVRKYFRTPGSGAKKYSS